MDDLLGLDLDQPTTATTDSIPPAYGEFNGDIFETESTEVTVNNGSKTGAVLEANAIYEPQDVYAQVNKTFTKEKPKKNGAAPLELNIFGAGTPPPVPKRAIKTSNDATESSKKHVSWATSHPIDTSMTSQPNDVIHPVSSLNEVITETPSSSDKGVELPKFSSDWGNVFGEIDDGKEYKEPTTELEVWQFKVKAFVDNFSVRLFNVVLILMDITLTIFDLAFVNKSDTAQDFYDVTALVVSCIFMIDLLLRIFAYGPKNFFSQKWEVLDAFIIVLTFSITVVYFVLDQYIQTTGAASLARLIVLARALRVVRFARIFYGKEQMKTSSRQTVSQNKRRYQKDGFDLDLTYVTDRVIAMSFPSSGRQSIFRNPIEEVSRFMKTKHPNNYKVYNLCSERGYDPSWFEGNVKRIFIDDHNVPKLKDLLEFTDDARTWMRHPNHIVAIHCKGGKGRTGTVVCTWLLEADMFSTAKEALEYFGDRRTDLEVGETFQGVETASQIRYVEYFEQVKKHFGGKMPPSRKLYLKKVTIFSIKGVGRGNGSDLTMQIVVGGKEHFNCKFGEQYNCQIMFDDAENKVTCKVDDCKPLEGDVKVRFTSSTKELPRGYDNCPFYFWFNTSFVPASNKLLLKREELDNPHKKKTWHIFQEDFAIEMEFEESIEEDC